jgi:hypothetical protein
MKYIYILIIACMVYGCGRVYVDDVLVAGGNNYDEHNYLLEVWNKTDYTIGVRYKRVSINYEEYDLEDSIMPSGSKAIKVKRTAQSANITVVYGGIERIVSTKLAYLEDKAKVEITYQMLVGYKP